MPRRGGISRQGQSCDAVQSLGQAKCNGKRKNHSQVRAKVQGKSRNHG